MRDAPLNRWRLPFSDNVQYICHSAGKSKVRLTGFGPLMGVVVDVGFPVPSLGDPDAAVVLIYYFMEHFFCVWNVCVACYVYFSLSQSPPAPQKVQKM